MNVSIMNCGISRSDNLKRHQDSCQVQNEPEAILETGAKRKYDAKSYDDSSILILLVFLYA